MRSKTRLGLLFVLSLLATGSYVRVAALPPGSSGYDIYYYSDASMTEVVGERYMGCTGTPTSSGIQTAYSDTLSWQCAPNGGGGGGSSCTTTTCQKHEDADHNIWYSDCVTSTSQDACFWRMCGAGPGGNITECGGD